MMVRRRVLAAATVASLVCVPSWAMASPWTLPQHELVLSTDLSFASADSEFLTQQDGESSPTLQLYPLNGRFNSSSMSLSARYGFTDQFEMEVRASFKLISFDADPVILDISPIVETDENGKVAQGDQTATRDDATLEQARASVIDFSSSRLGAADMDVYARYNLYKGPIVITPQLSAKIPLGYESPSETFSSLDPGAAVFNVGDDVALGDGQIDLAASLLVGTYLPWTRTFIRGDIGFNKRFGAPGDQVIANGKVGQFLLDRLIVFGGVRYANTVIEGSSIGSTFVDTQPTQTAADYEFANVEIRDLYLDRDFVTMEVGAIVNLDRVEMQVVYEDVLAGENYADLSGVTVSFVTAIPDATKQGGEELEATEEVEVVEEVLVGPDGEIVEEVEVVEEPVEVPATEPEPEVPSEPEPEPQPEPQPPEGEGGGDADGMRRG